MWGTNIVAEPASRNGKGGVGTYADVYKNLYVFGTTRAEYFASDEVREMP